MEKDIKQRGNPSEVAWQNKDITLKVFADNFKGKTFEAFGIPETRVVMTMPTQLPAIEADELKIDNLFLLEDGSCAIVDYESAYTPGNKVKYLNYIARVVRRLYNENGKIPSMRVIIIYTADVLKNQTDHLIDLGKLGHLRIDESFLSELDAQAILERISAKLGRAETLDDVDLMQLIISPLIHAGMEEKQRAVGTALDLAEQIPEEDGYCFALAAIYVFTDKIITESDRDRIRRKLKMTKLGQEFWEEAFRSGNEQGMEKGIEQGARQANAKNKKELDAMVARMLRDGLNPKQISKYTGRSVDEIRAIEQTSLASV